MRLNPSVVHGRRVVRIAPHDFVETQDFASPTRILPFPVFEVLRNPADVPGREVAPVYPAYVNDRWCCTGLSGVRETQNFASLRAILPLFVIEALRRENLQLLDPDIFKLHSLAFGL